MGNQTITEPAPPKSDRARPGRRRLIIDFNQPVRAKARGAERTRRWSKPLVILGTMSVIVALVAAGGVYFWWQYYKTTPAYSLALLVDAAQKHDLAVVEEFVDTDKVVRSLASRITEKTAARYGAMLSPSMRKRVESLVPALLPRVKQSARPVFARRVQEIFERSEPKPFIILAIGLPYVLNINSEGDEAKVTAPALDREVELVLQRDGERWKIVGIKDDAVVERIVDGIISDFPAIGQVK